LSILWIEKKGGECSVSTRGTDYQMGRERPKIEMQRNDSNPEKKNRKKKNLQRGGEKKLK